MQLLYLQHNFLTGVELGTEAAAATGNAIPAGASLCLQYNCMVPSLDARCPIKSSVPKLSLSLCPTQKTTSDSRRDAAALPPAQLPYRGGARNGGGGGDRQCHPGGGVALPAVQLHGSAVGRAVPGDGMQLLYLQHNFLTGVELGTEAAAAIGNAIPAGASLCLQYNCMVPPLDARCPVQAGTQQMRPADQCPQWRG
ncbi:hypothetical protein ZIOFF_030771 [Zingiber officinale]|uniref:Uncharacterized protein n=1 Tax=Zingiber officinale TaxID=94328 RepID=A0A8J5GYI4_ZINOF|nr:hypothetical protein ZIOFF_030771 [Zingiber officinale]